MIKLRKEVGFLIMMLVVLGFTYFLPYAMLLGKGEFAEHSEYLVKADLFTNIYIAGFIGVILVWIILYLLKKNDKFGDNAGIFNVGEKPGWDWLKKRNIGNLQLTWFMTIVFSIFFLVGNMTQWIKGSFIGLNFLPQQFTPIDSIIFSSLFTPTAENLMFAGVLGLFYVLTNVFFINLEKSKKFKVQISDHQSIMFIIAIFISASLGVIWHMTAYSTSTLALYNVFFFWMIMGVMALITGSWTVPLMFHMLNNFFLDFGRLFTSDALLFVTMSIITFLGVGYYLTYRKRLLGYEGGVNE